MRAVLSASAGAGKDLRVTAGVGNAVAQVEPGQERDPRAMGSECIPRDQCCKVCTKGKDLRELLYQRTLHLSEGEGVCV